jgi:hypothetical protein
MVYLWSHCQHTCAESHPHKGGRCLCTAPDQLSPPKRKQALPSIWGCVSAEQVLLFSMTVQQLLEFLVVARPLNPISRLPIIILSYGVPYNEKGCVFLSVLNAA